MEKVRLGNTGMTVSRIGFGGIPIQRLSEGDAVNVVKRRIELGIDLLDTANAYTTSEERIGKAISAQRENLVIATKTLSRTSSPTFSLKTTSNNRHCRRWLIDSP